MTIQQCDSCKKDSHYFKRVRQIVKVQPTVEGICSYCFEPIKVGA